MRVHSVRRSWELFNEPPDRVWMTTADVARVLELTGDGVRWLARTKRLSAERAISGQWLFRRADVRRFVLQRADERSRTREGHLRAVRVSMLKAPHEPRQLSLFGARLRLVRSQGPGEGSLRDPEVKASRSLDKAAGSKSVDYVNRKAASR
jgi:hypothetical protein